MWTNKVQLEYFMYEKGVLMHYVVSYLILQN